MSRVVARMLDVNISHQNYCAGVPSLIAASGHLPLTKTLWSQIVKSGDTVVDATCGKGQDALYIANLALNGDQGKNGKVYCIDVQNKAIQATKQKFILEFPHYDIMESNIFFNCCSHERFPDEINESSVSLLIYNLGYFPRGRTDDNSVENDSQNDDDVITSSSTTITSLQNGTPLIKNGGLLTVTAYRNHPGGLDESIAVEKFISELDPLTWRTFSHAPMNRPHAPIVFTAYRNNIKKVNKIKIK